jgi:hypothetical protein
MQKCSIKIECQEISQSQTTKHKQCQQKAAKNCHPKNNWGQININFQLKGAEADGGFLRVGYHKSSAPISLCPF